LDTASRDAAPTILPNQGWPISSLAFSPEGQVLAATGENNALYLWDITNPTAAPILLTGHTGSVNSVAFNPTGRSLATGGSDETVYIWPFLNGLYALACQQVHRNLTWEEWQHYLGGEAYRQTCPNRPIHPSVPG
jgi:WD40 repeat protein